MKPADLSPLRGMADTLPPESERLRRLELGMARVAGLYGYREVRVPLLERLELFRRSVGEASDIVNKEMYAFADRGGRDIALRPEATASVTRAVLAGPGARSGPLRLWYLGPMFRYERPQKGRARQFHQFGAEIFGEAGTGAERELILLTRRIFAELGLDKGLRLHLATLGTERERGAYSEVLRAWLSERQDRLDEHSRARIDANPLRVWDSKDPGTRELLRQAPLLREHLSAETLASFEGLADELAGLGIAVQPDPGLVRGLDYYTGVVFEWVSDALGAQDTLCGGGRYDGLAWQLGGKVGEAGLPAAGFSIGMERLLLALGEEPDPPPGADLYALVVEEACRPELAPWVETMRGAGVRVVEDLAGGPVAQQLRRARALSVPLVAFARAPGAALGQFRCRDERSGQDFDLDLGSPGWERGLRERLETQP